MKTTKESRSNEELKAGESWKSRLAMWSAGGVVAALVLEAVVAFKSCRTTEGFIELAIAAAVLGEVLFHRSASKDSEELQRRKDARIAELEERTAARKLDDKQIDRIADRVREFPGTQFNFGLGINTPEFVSLAGCIADALNKAKWVEIDCETTQIFARPEGRKRICIGAGVAGVLVGSSPETDLGDAQAALISALVDEGIDTKGANMRNPTVENAIRIMIGPKA